MVPKDKTEYSDNFPNGPNGFWAGMPWYVKAIAIVGVPSIISIGVVWSDRMQLIARIEENRAILLQVQVEQRKHMIVDEEANESVVVATKETNRILLAACVNDATTKPNPVEAQERCIGK
jgi:hypothetical protein